MVEIIDDVVGGGNFFDNLTVLNSVSNISFNEESRLLTFDEVEQANGYEVKMKDVNLNETYIVESPNGTLQVDIPYDTVTGHTLDFAITSLGDLKTTKNSPPATYSYTMQHETERKYTFLTNEFYSFVQTNVSGNIKGGGVKLSSLDAIDYQNNRFHVQGRAKNYKDKDFVFDLSTEDSTQPDLNRIFIIDTILTDFTKTLDLKYTYTENMTNVSEGLILGQSATFKEYLDNGYSIGTLQQTNSDFTILGNGLRSFSVNGIYNAMNDNGEQITFEANHVVTMQENESFTSSNQYLNYFNETGDADITDNGLTVKNEVLMNHLEIMKQIFENQQNQKN